MQKIFTAAQISKRCEELGEQAVRSKLAAGLMDQHFATHARVWLKKFDHERSESSQAESLAIASSAKDAAWVAAEAARDAASTAKTANIIATLALAGAAIAIAVSIVSAFVR